MMENQPAGEIVSRLISEHLKSWGMPADLSGRRQSNISANPDGPVEASAEIAA
jgi:hypothetical protein